MARGYDASEARRVEAAGGVACQLCGEAGVKYEFRIVGSGPIYPIRCDRHSSRLFREARKRGGTLTIFETSPKDLEASDCCGAELDSFLAEGCVVAFCVACRRACYRLSLDTGATERRTDTERKWPWAEYQKRAEALEEHNR